MGLAFKAPARPIWVLLLILVLASALPMVLFAAYVVGRLAEDQRQGQVTELVQRTRSLSAAVEEMLSGGVMTLNALASSQELSRGDLAGFYDEAMRFLGRQALVGTVAIVDSTGQIVFNTRLPFGTPLPQSGESVSAVEAVRIGKPVLSDLYQSNISGSYVVAINLPLSEGGLSGSALRLVFESSRLNSVLASQDLPPGWIAGVIDGQGRIAARSAAPEQYIGQTTAQFEPDRLPARSEGLARGMSKEGVPVLTYFKPMDEFGWFTAVGVPEHALYAPGVRSMLLVGAGGVLALVLGGLAAVVLSRRLGRQVSMVAEAASAMGRNEDVALERTGIRELDAVVSAQLAAKRLIAMREEQLEETSRLAEAAKEEAERANRAKSRFLAAASHDLRQPAQGLVLFHAGLRAHLGDAPGRADELLRGAEQAVHAMKTILDSMLDLSRIESGAVKPVQEVFALAEFLDQVKTEFSAHAAIKGLRFRVVETSLATRTDRALLAQIVRNLVTNALRYTRKGGIVVGCRRRGDKVLVQVVDTGVGIPEHALEEIFEEYIQLGNPERDREKGLGLGLAIVRRLAALLGVKILVHSRIGQGSTFAVEVSLAKAPPYRPCAAAPANEDLRGLIVLIDDET